MNPRSLIILAFVFLSLAHAAFAQSGGGTVGSICGSSSDCGPSAPYCVFNGFSSNCQATNSNGGSSGTGIQSSSGQPPSGSNGIQSSNGQPSSGGGNSGTTLINPLNGGATLQGFLTDILGFVVKIGSIIVILMLVYVGYKFVAAQGDPVEISEAKNMLLWTVVGALILLGAQAIASGIQATVTAISAGN
jgi:hypothetical protein